MLTIILFIYLLTLYFFLIIQEVCQTEFKPSELSFGGGALSGAYGEIDPRWTVEACREALSSGTFINIQINYS